MSRADSSPDSPPPAARFPLVEVLRGAAALLVLIYHVIEMGSWRKFPLESPWRIFRIGWIGVDLFLVISGFVITYSAVRDYRSTVGAHPGAREKGTVGFRRRFMTRRLLRIMPLYVLTSLVFLLVTPGMLGWPIGTLTWHLLTHALFIHNLDFDTFGSLNGVSWSLALEMQFYVLIALATPWLIRLGAARSWLLLTLIAIAYRWATTQILPPGASSVDHQFKLSVQLPGTLDAFGIGIALALASFDGGPRVKKLLQPSWRAFGAFAALAALSFMLTLQIFWPRPILWYSAEMITYWRTTLALSFGCFLAACLTFPRKELGILRPLGWFGTISYGVYLWHPMVISGLRQVPGMGGYRLCRWTLLATCCLAAFTWHWLEKPATQRRREKDTLKPEPAPSSEVDSLRAA